MVWYHRFISCKEIDIMLGIIPINRKFLHALLVRPSGGLAGRSLTRIHDKEY